MKNFGSDQGVYLFYHIIFWLHLRLKYFVQFQASACSHGKIQSLGSYLQCCNSALHWDCLYIFLFPFPQNTVSAQSLSLLFHGWFSNFTCLILPILSWIIYFHEFFWLTGFFWFIVSNEAYFFRIIHHSLLFFLSWPWLIQISKVFPLHSSKAYD